MKKLFLLLLLVGSVGAAVGVGGVGVGGVGVGAGVVGGVAIY